jgi:hypothetical protein
MDQALSDAEIARRLRVAGIEVADPHADSETGERRIAT